MPIPNAIAAIIAAIFLVVIGFASVRVAVPSSPAANVRDAVPSVDTQAVGAEQAPAAAELQSSTTQPQYSIPAGLRGDDDDEDDD